ncbi:MAG: amidohydrolase family protein [Nitrospinota bacterium]
MILPGLTDIHTHMREPGGTEKEDWSSGTAAALAGGITTILAMPNTNPPTINRETLGIALKIAKIGARCDYGLFLGAGETNAEELPNIAKDAVGLKMYLDQTFGPLKLDSLNARLDHFRNWPRHKIISIHAEKDNIMSSILLAGMFDRPIHICHVSLKDEIEMIKAAKENGIKITCEVTPHHLFICREDIAGREKEFEVRPHIAERSDMNALWENMDVIDAIATDHAPHTPAEKSSDNPPPGFPGLETSLPLMLTAVNDGRMKMENLIEKMYTNPNRIFGIPTQPDTEIEVDTEASWEIRGKDMFTKAAWSPFEGWKVKGRVIKVILRGREVFSNGKMLVEPGYGLNIAKKEEV